MPVDSPSSEPADAGWACTIAVHERCEFTAKRGDLDRRFFTPSATALEGLTLVNFAVASQTEVELRQVFGADDLAQVYGAP